MIVILARAKAAEHSAAAAKWKADGYAGPGPFEKRHGEPTLAGLVDAYVEECRARGICAASVAHTESKLRQWGSWLRSRRPRS